jgi:glucose/arabinose dehydrogenase
MRDHFFAPFIRLLLPALVALVVVAAPMPAAGVGLAMTLMEGGFSSPVQVTNAGDSRLFVVQKGGMIKIIGGGTFLDLTTKVSTSGERGLLSLAFPPNYVSSGLFYVMYTRQSDGDVMLSEFKRSSGDSNVADPNSERILLRIEHSSASNHNGGTLLFKQGGLGYLYMTIGDGGGSPGTRAQRLDLLVGKILRINPADPDGNGPLNYSIPTGNPYVGRSGLDEIWSYGLRNPWRCSFDDLTGKLFCGDVGEGHWEEVDRAKTGKGINFGWPRLEGNHYYHYPNHTQGDLCTSQCYYKPLLEYAHSVEGTDNSNIAGGFVSRRSGSSFYGQYIFADSGSGRIWAIPADAATGVALPPELADTSMYISSFGEGVDGKIYVVDLAGGAVYRLDGT